MEKAGIKDIVARADALYVLNNGNPSQACGKTLGYVVEVLIARVLTFEADTTAALRELEKRIDGHNAAGEMAAAMRATTSGSGNRMLDEGGDDDRPARTNRGSATAVVLEKALADRDHWRKEAEQLNERVKELLAQIESVRMAVA